MRNEKNDESASTFIHIAGGGGGLLSPLSLYTTKHSVYIPRQRYAQSFKEVSMTGKYYDESNPFTGREILDIYGQKQFE